MVLYGSRQARYGCVPSLVIPGAETAHPTQSNSQALVLSPVSPCLFPDGGQAEVRWSPCQASTSSTPRRPVTVEKSIGGKVLSIETGRLAKQASGAVVVRLGDTMTPGRHRGRPRPRGARFLPPDGRLPREGLCRGQVPRRLHQTRRPAHDQGNPHLPAHRPARSARSFPNRTATRSRSRPARSRPTARTTPTSLDDRRLGHPAPGPGPVPRPDRRASGWAGSTASSIPLPNARRARGERPRPGRRQHERRPSS